MTYETLKRFAEFLKGKGDAFSGAIHIAEPPEADKPHLRIDRDIISEDVLEFTRWNGQTWTNETPRKSGFYWLYTEDDLEIVKVVRDDDRITVYPAGPEESYEIEDESIFDDIAWAGPLEPPPR
jgi:hypothetical protein